MKDFAPLLRAILESIADKTTFQSEPSLSRILQEHPRLVVVFNHATPLSWLPAISLLTQETVQCGGESRVPRGIVDHFFYKFPVLRSVGEFISQSDRPLRFDQLVRSFEEGEATDLVVFPEGSNSFLEDVDSIQQFRSSRFMELAIKTGTPILLVVHKGSERWSRPADLPTLLKTAMMLVPSSFVQRMALGGKINFPWPFEKISDFRMRSELWTNHLAFRKVPHHEDPSAKEKVEEHSEALRSRMEEIYAGL